MSRRIFIVSGDYYVARTYARDKGLALSQWNYVNSAASLLGASGGEIYFVRNFWQNPDHWKIKRQAEQRLMKVNYDYVS